MKLPKLPAPNVPTLAVSAVAGLGLVLFSPNAPIRAVGLGALGAVGAIAHKRRAGAVTTRVLSLAEGKWAEDLQLAKQLGISEGRSLEKETARTLALQQAQARIEAAENEMRPAFERMQRDLETAIADRDRAAASYQAICEQLEAKERELAARELTVETREQRIAITENQIAEQYKNELETAQKQVETAKNAIVNQSALITQLENDLNAAQQKFDAILAKELHDLRTVHSVQVAQLERDLAEYRAGSKAIARRRAAEAKLQTIEGLLEKFGPKPVFIAGPEGSGKGTTIVAYLRALAAKFGGVCPVVFDPSEDRIWELTGIPSTPNRELFFSLIEQTLAKAKSTRVDRTQDNFNSQPPIVFVIDESASLYTGLTQNEINSYQTQLDQLRTRGNKYGLIPVFTGISEQIQNLKSNNKQILNSGNIAVMWRFLLNSVLEEYAAKFPNRIGEDLTEWLAVSPNEYRAAILTTEGGAAVVSPIKHPSHHAQTLGEREPTIPVVGPVLATPPDYWPLAAKLLFQPEPQPEKSHSPEQENTALSPLASGFYSFLVSANEPVSANKFKRFGARFYAGASRVKPEDLESAIAELIARGMVSTETGAKGGVLYRVSLVA